MGGGQIRTGWVCRSEHIAERNGRLLEIEVALEKAAKFSSLFVA
jgi:enolase